LAEATPPATMPHEKRKLDDVLLAMDVVDTLRHREEILMREMDAEGREKKLVARLREIYTAQGIDVSDDALREGVKALEERRFLYKPPEPSLPVTLAKIYVSRDRWLKPAMGAVAALVVGFGAWHFGVAEPARAKAAAARIELAETLPAELEGLREGVQSVAEEDSALRLAETYFQDGMAAVRAGDAGAARQAVDQLETLAADVMQIYDVRVVYGPGEPRSGVFRIPDDAPQTRNYYLIVEAVDPSGRVVEVPVTSEEDQSVRRVRKWGQRVSEDAFNAVAADKADDQIIQNNVIGTKRSGLLRPDYRVETPGGAILEW